MGAAEQERVDPGRGRQREDELAGRVALAEQRRERVAHGRLDLRTGQPAGLDHGHERRGRVLVDLDRRVLLLDRVEVGVRADGGRRGDDPDPADPGGQDGRPGTRPDHPQDRQAIAPPGVAQGDRGRGVAGDHDRLDVALHEPIERLAGERQDLLVGARPVGCPGVVAKVHRRLGGQPAEDLAEDRQTADAGVEDADRSGVHHVSDALRRSVDRRSGSDSRRRTCPG